MKPETYILSLWRRPQTGSVENIRIEVIYDQGTGALIDIALELPLKDGTNEALAREIEKLGKALLRAAQSPSELVRHDRPANAE